jgi:hypothetical protein
MTARGLLKRATGRGGAALLLVGVFLALFHRALFQGESFYIRDLRGFHRPLKSVLAPLFLASRGVPLWNPLSNSGQPFAANPQHEVFHPLTLLFLALPFEWAFRLEVMLPYAAAAVAMRFFLRSLGRSGVAAAFGALSYAAGGALLSASSLMPSLLGYAVLPAFLGFLHRVARGGASRDVGGAAVAFGLVALSGEVPAIFAAAGLGVLTLAAAPRPRPRSALARGALAYVLGGLVGAAALLPGWALAREGERAHGLPAAAAEAWSMPDVRPLELLHPDLLGHMEEADERWIWGRGLYPGRSAPFLFSIYAGLSTPLLAAVALGLRPRACAVWTLAAAGAALLALGSHAPFFALARSVVPFFASLRYPERFALAAAVALAPLAALGLDLAARDPRARRLLARLALAAGAVLAVSAGFVAARADAPNPLFWLPGRPELPGALVARVAVRDLALQALFAAALFLLARARSSPRALVAGVVALTAVDLCRANARLVATMPIPLLAAPPPFLAPALEARARGPLFHLASQQESGGPQSLALAPPPMPLQWGLGTALDLDFDVTSLASSNRARDLFWEAVNGEPTLLGTLLTRRGVASVARFARDRTRGPAEVVLVKDPRPFAFCARRVQKLSSWDDWPRAVRALGAEAADAATVLASDVPEEPAPCRVTILERRPQWLAARVEAAGTTPSFLSVNQTFARGWTARVDGTEAPLLATDVSLSGLVVPPGAHTVSLEYRDPWLTAGMGLSACGLVAAAVLARSGRA